MPKPGPICKDLHPSHYGLGVRLTFLENKRVLLAPGHGSVFRKEKMEGLAVEKPVVSVSVP